MTDTAPAKPAAPTEAAPEVAVHQPTIDAAVKVILDRIPATKYAGDARLLRIAANLVRGLGETS